MKIYSLYKGEKEIAFGTIEEIAKKTRGKGKNDKILYDTYLC